jgi:hypothetical protein
MGCRLIAGKAVDYAADAGHMACSANIATARTAARLRSVGISSCKDAQNACPACGPWIQPWCAGSSPWRVVPEGPFATVDTPKKDAIGNITPSGAGFCGAEAIACARPYGTTYFVTTLAGVVSTQRSRARCCRVHMQARQGKSQLHEA